ncbi:MAG: alpha/beta fold hydrolase [Burkholderiales bacterium]|nr:alpha/beta fold hydrolase [Burkholderiales bacterium]
MSCQWIEANGVLLRYEYLASAAKTVVLVHEMGGALESWDPILADLAGRWSVLRYDLRGSGLSEKPHQSLSVDTLADDLDALLEGLEIDGQVAVVGVALGCATSVHFAAKYPGRVAELILMSPALDVAPAERDMMVARAGRFETEGIRNVLGTLPIGKRDIHEILRLTADPSGLAAQWRMLAHLDLDASLGAIRCPALLLAGTRDRRRHPEYVGSVARKIPGARMIVLESGHIMPVETPALAAATISKHLTERGF